MKLLDGKAISQTIQEEIKDKIKSYAGRAPCLAVILVGNDPASEIYVRRKRQACENVGMLSIFLHLNANIEESELLWQIQRCNQDPLIDGILVQLPLPAHINTQRVTCAIVPSKDVDGFHPINVGKLFNGETDGFAPCTPLGIQTMLTRNAIDVAGKHVVIVGRSNIVGKPMAALFIQNSIGGNATVTIAHSRTRNLVQLCLSADIIVAAIGQPRFIKQEMVKEGAIVIDVGINRIENAAKPSGYEIVGDVDFDLVKLKSAFITPVPGGVGPLTIAMLLQNTLKSFVASKRALE